MKLTFFACLAFAGLCTTQALAQTTPSSSFCPGDGSAAACPCSNSGSVGHGCGSGTFTTGAILTASGTAGTSLTTGSLVLTASDISGPGLFFQGTSRVASGAGIPFGDGLLCVGGAIIRLGLAFPISTQSASIPNSFDPNPLHVSGGVSVGDVRHYQCWYRDVSSFCTPSTHNLTQGLTITWGP